MKESKNKLFLTKCSAALVLAVALSCSCSYAQTDFSYIQINSPKTVKLSNPLYLDTSKTVKPELKLMTPYTGEFDESDYFSSSIGDDLPPPEIVEIPQTISEPPPRIDNNNPNNFFAPPGQIVEETVETIIPDEKTELTQTPEPETGQEMVADDVNTYAASVGKNIEEGVAEGRIVTQIDFDGLQTIKGENIIKEMKTQVGSVFNQELLQQDLQRIYAIGYFTENMAIEPEINPNGSISLKFTLEENIPVQTVSVTGNTVISTMELLPFITPLKGYPQNISIINNAIDKINNYYHSKGYVLAGVSSIDDSDDGNLNFGITEGTIGKIFIEGNEKTKDYVITRNILSQEGTVYNENYLKEDISRLYSTKIFKEVNREIIPSETYEDAYDIKVVVKEESPNAISLGAGIDSGLGAFGSVGFTENNLMGRGQRLSLTGILGSGILLSDASIKNHMNYQVELSFFEPYFLNADNSLASKLYYREMGSWQIPLAIERRIGFNTVVEHKVRGHKNLTTNLGLGFEHIKLKEGDSNKISELYALRNLDISQRAKQLEGGYYFNLSPGIRYSTLDSEEIPRTGVIASAKFIEAISLESFDRTNGRLAGGVTKYFPVKKKSSFSLTARGGVKVHGDDMPEVMAFRLGGPYSIRGFRMSGVGTGDAFIMGSAELATPVPFVDRMKWDFLQRLRLTFFVDAGKVFDPTISNVLFDRPASAITAGVGLRLYVPGVGPVSVDYGIPLTNPGDYGSTGGYFTFGTGGMNNYNY